MLYPSFNPNSIMKFYIQWPIHNEQAMSKQFIDRFDLKEGLIVTFVSSRGIEAASVILTCQETDPWLFPTISDTKNCGLNPR